MKALTNTELVNFAKLYLEYGEDWVEEQGFSDEEMEELYGPIMNRVDDWGQEYIDFINVDTKKKK